jgi:hypothetical protein
MKINITFIIEIICTFTGLLLLFLCYDYRLFLIIFFLLWGNNLMMIRLINEKKDKYDKSR